MILMSQFSKTPSASTPFSDPELCAFMQQFEQATQEFINGNNQPWLALALRRDDATIMGAWGAYERGWKDVGPRYDWAAARFQPSGAKLSVEYLASGATDTIAYTVAIERCDPLIVGEDKPRPQELRVTHIFCKHDGKWKFIHRQADPLMAKTTPASVLRRWLPQACASCYTSRSICILRQTSW